LKEGSFEVDQVNKGNDEKFGFVNTDEHGWKPRGDGASSEFHHNLWGPCFLDKGMYYFGVLSIFINKFFENLPGGYYVIPPLPPPPPHTTPPPCTSNFVKKVRSWNKSLTYHWVMKFSPMVRTSEDEFCSVLLVTEMPRFTWPPLEVREASSEA
jgi:hypothetical protein